MTNETAVATDIDDMHYVSATFLIEQEQRQVAIQLPLKGHNYTIGEVALEKFNAGDLQKIASGQYTMRDEQGNARSLGDFLTTGDFLTLSWTANPDPDTESRTHLYALDHELKADGLLDSLSQSGCKLRAFTERQRQIAFVIEGTVQQVKRFHACQAGLRQEVSRNGIPMDRYELFYKDLLSLCDGLVVSECGLKRWSQSQTTFHSDRLRDFLHASFRSTGTKEERHRLALFLRNSNWNTDWLGKFTCHREENKRY